MRISDWSSDVCSSDLCECGSKRRHSVGIGHDQRHVPAWFMDARDTAVTKYAEAGCTIPEICSYTGHDPESAYKILKHYLALNDTMADSALAKLVRHEEQLRNKKSSNH